MKIVEGSKEDHKLRLQQVTDFYNTLSLQENLTTLMLRHDNHSQNDAVVDEVIKQSELYTDYHAVEKEESISVNW